MNVTTQTAIFISDMLVIVNPLPIASRNKALNFAEGIINAKDKVNKVRVILDCWRGGSAGSAVFNVLS